MLSELDILKINKVLTICGTYRLNQREIDVINASGFYTTDECSYIKISLKIMTNRSKFDTSQNKYIDNLIMLSDKNNCNINREISEIVDVKVPMIMINL